MSLKTAWLTYKQEVLAGYPDKFSRAKEALVMLGFYAGAQVALGLVERHGEDPYELQSEVDRFEETTLYEIADQIFWGSE